MAEEKVKAGSLTTVKPKDADKVFLTQVQEDGSYQSKNALVSDIRNLADSLEDSDDKAINVKIANEIVKKITDLTTNVNNSFGTVNTNFENVNKAINSNKNSIKAANDNLTLHEEDSDVHVTAEKKQEWDSKAAGTHTHKKAQITDFPSSMKNPNALTISLNGASQGAYDGSTAKSINITPGNIGAAAASHGTHVQYSTDTPKANGTATAGTNGAVARADHVHPLQTSVSGSSGSCTGNAATATKVRNALTISLNGASQGAYDGSAAKSINITPGNIGAATSGHTHDDRYYTESEINSKINTINSQMNDRMKNILSITRNINGKNIKLIGDSITEGNGGSNYSSTGETIFDTYKANITGHCWANSLKTYLESKFSCVVKNWGIGGATSTFIVNNLNNLIKSTDDIVICKIGINDRNITDGKTVLENNLKTIYNYVKSLGKEIIFISPIWCGSDTGNFTALDIDNLYMKVFSNLGVEYISLYKLFIEYIENKNIAPYSLLNNDQIHPNDKGYDIMYYLILSKLGFSSNKSIMLDTGWIDLSVNTSAFEIREGYKPQIRRINSQVFIRGYVRKLNADNAVVLCSIPDGFIISNPKEKQTFTNLYEQYGVWIGDKLIFDKGYIADNIYNYICLDESWLIN